MFKPRTLLVSRFALIIASLCYSVLERANNLMPLGGILEPLPQSLRTSMWDRMAELGRRFAMLAARLETGTLPAPRRRIARAGAGRDVPARAGDEQLEGPLAALPRDFGWFSRLSPHAHGAVAHLRLLLRDPEMAALVARHPAFGRVIRPLCHMLGIAPHPHLLALQPLPAGPRTARPRTGRPERTAEAERRAELFSRKTSTNVPRRRRRAKNA